MAKQWIFHARKIIVHTTSTSQPPWMHPTESVPADTYAKWRLVFAAAGGASLAEAMASATKSSRIKCICAYLFIQYIVTAFTTRIQHPELSSSTQHPQFSSVRSIPVVELCPACLFVDEINDALSTVILLAEYRPISPYQPLFLLILLSLPLASPTMHAVFDCRFSKRIINKADTLIYVGWRRRDWGRGERGATINNILYPLKYCFNNTIAINIKHVIISIANHWAGKAMYTHCTRIYFAQSRDAPEQRSTDRPAGVALGSGSGKVWEDGGGSVSVWVARGARPEKRIQKARPDIESEINFKITRP